MNQEQTLFDRTRSIRDIYTDMAQRERGMLSDRGIARPLDYLINIAAGSYSDLSGVEGRDSATGYQLRALIPEHVWAPMQAHLIELKNGVLYVAALEELNTRQQESLIQSTKRLGFVVKSLSQELWDRAELMATLRTSHDAAGDRTSLSLVEWLNDLDNGLLLAQLKGDILAEAIKLRASDIHLIQDNEPESPNWIRYRIDGDLVPMHLLPAEAMARLTTLIKRDAGLNFGDRQSMKDGRFSFFWQGRPVDVRVAAGPHARDGEKITLRLLDKASLKGFAEIFRPHPEVGNYLLDLINPPIKGQGGFILLSGPTGSGKTSTLFATIQQIDRKKRHVLTIEDPIEYEIRYATQWQVMSGMKGYDFGDLIRASLRHDPDYIIIGEMRDSETVEAALKAAESGHTVISTIHADTALQTIERLKALLPFARERSAVYTLAQQLNLVLNQRLIKTLCTGCSTNNMLDKVLDKKDIDLLGLPKNTPIKLHNSNGCDVCNRTGFSGRTLLLEALILKGLEIERAGIVNAIETGHTHDLLQLPSVQLFSRADNIRKLVSGGMIDPRQGVAMLALS